MKIETFRQRLQAGKSVGYDYQADDKTGMIGLSWHEDEFVLTWEEFPEGDFYNEQNYTRDEVHHFATIEDVLEFLKINKINPRTFRP